MEDKTTEQVKKQAKILMSKCQNIVQLCEKKDENGKRVFFVLFNVGKTAFWIKLEELEEVMFQFRDLVDLKLGSKK